MDTAKIRAFLVIISCLWIPGTSYSDPPNLCIDPPCKPLRQTDRLSLNPYGSSLRNGAHFVQSAFDAPISLPDEARSSFFHGFTIPENYTGGPLTLELLVEGFDTGCTFVLSAGALFRMGVGEPRDFGDAVDGLEALDASSPHAISSDHRALGFAAADTPQGTVRVRFVMTDEGFSRPLQPGDALNFGITRLALSALDHWDDCGTDLGIGGMSVVYYSDTLGQPPRPEPAPKPNPKPRPVLRTLDVQVFGNGRVTSIPVGIDCGNDCQEFYRLGTVVELTAVADPGWHFDGWSLDCVGAAATTQVTLDADRTCRAVFSQLQVGFLLTVTRSGGDGTGRVDSLEIPGIECGVDCSEVYPPNQIIQLWATPDEGSVFTEWTGCDPDLTEGPSCGVRMTGPRNVDARFD